MSKLIIDNRSPLADDEALRYVQTVIRMGRLTDGPLFDTGRTFIDGVTVTEVENDKSRRFVVTGGAK
jgi:hypothetical protein